MVIKFGFENWGVREVYMLMNTGFMIDMFLHNVLDGTSNFGT
jgi:hypothetical protein